MSVPWPAAGSILAGLLSLYFIRYLWPYRDHPGARFFVGTIGCEALWALSYGVALLVFDPVLRALFEVPIWVGINFIGVFFLAFALEYTGRGALVRSKWMGLVAATQVLHTAVVVTNPLHHVAWSGYHVDPVFGAATVSYAHQPWLFVNFVGIYVMVAAGSFLLLETFFSYGPLYRAQTAAIALSPVLPGVAFTLWLFEIGVSPPLNLTPLTFPIHLGFDTYAFFRRNLFELTPAARRAGDRAAIDDLGSPVVIVDGERRIVNANEAARRSFADGGDLLGRDLDAVVAGIDPSASEDDVTVVTGDGRREFAVNSSVLEDAAGNTIGHALVFQDVTEERRREQRLTVLNRVLRHNLRNDLNVVQGNVGLAAERVDDDELREILALSERKAEEVMELAEKARTIDRLMNVEGSVAEPVEVRRVVEEVRDDLLADAPDARIEIDVPEGVRLRADPRLVRAVFENLVENAVEHADSGDPLVEVALVDPGGDDRPAVFEVRDDGPGIPDHERRTIETGEETPLEHGSGLGLWIVEWGVDSLGGTVRFADDGPGTTVRLELPTHDAEG